MIEQSLLISLAAITLMSFPLWQRLTESRPTYDDMSVDNFSKHETNFFARKPFTCLYCITFWLAVVACAVGRGAWSWWVPAAAPTVAVALDRVIKLIPISL